MEENEKTGTSADPKDGAAPASAPPPASATPAQSAQVDFDKIEQIIAERTAKTQEKTMRDMLKQHGLDDEAIRAMVEEYKAKQVTPEQALEQLKKERDDGFAERDAKIAAYEREKILRGHGLTDDEDIEIYSIRIERLATDGKTFEQAAQEYFAAHPMSQKVPASATFGGTGTTPMSPTESEAIKADYANAVKNRNHAEMSRLIRFAHIKGIDITRKD